jgi:hypothetical protein
MEEWPRIVGVAAFWNNEREDGLSIRLELESGTSDDFMAGLRRALAFYDASAPALCLGRLSYIATHKDGLSLEDLTDAVAAIFWLESQGHLQPDEYNGVVWIGVREGRLVVVPQNDVLTSLAMHARLSECAALR